MVSGVYRLKILHLISTLYGGGAEKQMAYLLSELSRRGHEVHVAYIQPGVIDPELPGVVRHQLKVQSNYDPLLACQIFKLLRVIKPDVVQTWNLQMDVFGGAVANITGMPWILRESSSGMIVKYWPKWKAGLRVFIARSAGAIVSNSSGGDEYWKMHAPKKSRFIVKNGLPIAAIQNVEKFSVSRLGKNNSPIILYVGRLTLTGSANKNLHTFLNVIARISERQKVITLICGDGPHRQELEMMAQSLGVEGSVHFLGQQSSEAVWLYMKKASVFVSLSEFEGCPNSVMEAMACGCPIVLSDIPAHREILDDSCAIFVNTFDIEGIANSIGLALENIETSKIKSQIAQKRSGEWSIFDMTNNYEQVYQAVSKPVLR